MKYVDVGSAKVGYRIEGSGPGLVLIHGTGGNSDTNWSQMVESLAKHRTVVRPDYSGSGLTTDDGRPLTIEAVAEQVVRAAENAGVRPFDLVGFSLGAAIAAFIAAEYPRLVRSVVLLAGFASGEDPRQQMQFKLWRDLIERDRHAMARLVLVTGFSPDFLSSLGHAAIENAVNDIVANNNWGGMARQVDLDLALDIRNQARRITQPTLVIGCTYDHMVPPAHAKELVSLIPHAQYREMETGHLVPLEAPDALCKEILEFVRTAAA